MNWIAMSSLFGLSMVKFMFAPIPGPGTGLSFLETYLSCTSGAILSSAIFFYSASYFMNRAQEKAAAKAREQLKKGLETNSKKKFTRMNKFVVKMKRSIGIIGISFWAPLFLSIPLGSIIVAKFYGHNKKAYPLIVLGIFFNGAVITGLVYLF